MSESSISSKKIAKNVFLSILVQIISLLTSFVLGFIVPKFIDKFEYANWQTYTLYVYYVSIFQFGLLDGFLLRYAQYDYNELDKPRIRSQFKLMLAFTSAIALCGCAFSAIFLQASSKWLLIFISLGVITKNLYTYSSYIYQSTNRINQYALMVLLQRATYAFIIVVLLFAKVQNFYLYCIADLIGDLVATVVSIPLSKRLYIGKGLPLRKTLREAALNISSGSQLLIANLSSGLLISGAKMVTQWRWDPITFSDVSFGFSLFGVFVSFTTAISTVLFPSLKRLDPATLPDVYKNIRDSLSPILFTVILAYFPLCRFLGFWLPAYQQSLVYLGVLLPLLIFSSKVSLLTNNYFKIYRKEKLMLIINILSVLICFLLCLFCAFVLNDLDLLLYALILVCILRSIVSEIVVMRLIKARFVKDFIIELFISVIFVIAARYFTLWLGCVIYAGALLIYLFLYREAIKKTFATISAKLHRKRTR